MKNKIKVFFAIAIIISILAATGCISDKRTDNVKKNKSINISKIFIESKNNITEKDTVPKETPVQNKPIKKKKFASVKIIDMSREENYPTVLICLQGTNKSWGNISPGNINDNANDGGNHLWQPSSSAAINFEDGIHTVYIEDLGITLPNNEIVIIEKRINCGQELLESIQ